MVWIPVRAAIALLSLSIAVMAQDPYRVAGDGCLTDLGEDSYASQHVAHALLRAAFTLM